MLVAQCVDSRRDFLETTSEKFAGTSFYMFWSRFIPVMFSALSATFLCGQAFVCFSARWAVHYFAVKQTSTATVQLYVGYGNEYNGCVSVRYNFVFISLHAAVYKSSQNNNVKQPHSVYLRERELYDR